MRRASMERNTKETKIRITLDLDGTGKGEINTGCGFLNHMLTLFAAHGRFDLDILCEGDRDVDMHHSAEDIGIVLGSLFDECLGNKAGFTRYGYMILPMDESLVLTAVDFSGRSFLGYDVAIPARKVGNFDTELVEEFWTAFTRTAKCALHFKVLSGKNTHHIIEGMFKSAARSIKEAVRIDPESNGSIPSTKGVLE